MRVQHFRCMHEVEILRVLVCDIGIASVDIPGTLSSQTLGDNTQTRWTRCSLIPLYWTLSISYRRSQENRQSPHTDYRQEVQTHVWRPKPAFENRLLKHAPQQLIVPRGLRKYDLSGRTLDLGHSGQMRTICFGTHVSCPHLNERASTRGPRGASRHVPPKLGRRLPNGTNKHDMFVKLTRKPSYGRHPIPYKLAAHG